MLPLPPLSHPLIQVAVLTNTCSPPEVSAIVEVDPSDLSTASFLNMFYANTAGYFNQNGTNNQLNFDIFRVNETPLSIGDFLLSAKRDITSGVVSASDFIKLQQELRGLKNFNQLTGSTVALARRDIRDYIVQQFKSVTKITALISVVVYSHALDVAVQFNFPFVLTTGLNVHANLTILKHALYDAYKVDNLFLVALPVLPETVIEYLDELDPTLLTQITYLSNGHGLPLDIQYRDQLKDIIASVNKQIHDEVQMNLTAGLNQIPAVVETNYSLAIIPQSLVGTLKTSSFLNYVWRDEIYVVGLAPASTAKMISPATGLLSDPGQITNVVVLNNGISNKIDPSLFRVNGSENGSQQLLVELIQGLLYSPSRLL